MLQFRKILNSLITSGKAKKKITFKEDNSYSLFGIALVIMTSLMMTIAIEKYDEIDFKLLYGEDLILQVYSSDSSCHRD